MKKVEKFQKVWLPDSIARTAKDLICYVAKYCSKRDGTKIEDELPKACKALYSSFKGTGIDRNPNNQKKLDN